MTFDIYTILFITLTLTGFYLINPEYRLSLLVLASSVFVLLQNRGSLVVMLLITFITYIAGICIYTLPKSNAILKKSAFILSITVITVLFFLGKTPMIEHDFFHDFLVPIGFSFYTFQGISYLSDIYSGKIACEKNIKKYVLYMSWFPKFVSGPIERAGYLIPQEDKLSQVKLIDSNRLIKASSYIIWGLFLKLMIADRSDIIVNNIFQKSEEYGSLALIFGALLYSIQLYCDFAGYTDIAIGVSTLFGLELSQNFKTPYFTENITDFWKSWHMTLSAFLRDYIYIPMGGNRKGQFRKYINVMAVFVICGIWHGRALKYLAWGLLHGFYSILTDLLKKSSLFFIVHGIAGKVLTFIFVTLAWIFFKADSFSLGLKYIGNMLTAGYKLGLNDTMIKMGTNYLQICILLLSVLIVFILDKAASKTNTTPPEILIKTDEFRRDISFLLITVIILIFGMYGNQDVKEFIYKDF